MLFIEIKFLPALLAAEVGGFGEEVGHAEGYFILKLRISAK